MESGRDAPNGVISDDAAQTKRRGHGGECGVGSIHAQSHQATKTTSVHHRILKVHVEIVGRWRLDFFHLFRLFVEHQNQN